MKKLLKGLELREQIGGFVQPFEFNEETRKELARWLDICAINRLQDLTEFARQVERDHREEPTLGDNRAVLNRIQSLTAALAQAINQAPCITEAELTLIGHRDFGDMFKFEKIATDLERAALCIESELENMPKQSKRGSPVFMVSCIAEIALNQGLTLSDSEHGKFFSLCRCVFEAAGIHQDPRGAIRAFMKEQA